MKLLTKTALALASLSLQAPALAAAPSPAHHVRGTISALSATTLTVATATGAVSVPLDAKTKVVGVSPASASEITAGTYIGTANVPGAGAARALEVVVFPKAMAGAGEGDYAWDLPAGGKHSMMTNGTVAAGGHSMMTNATVSTVSGGSAKTVKLVYKGGTKTVLIPGDAPVVDIAPGTKALLVTGAHVVVALRGAGKAPAAVVVVGKRGAVPPM